MTNLRNLVKRVRKKLFLAHSKSIFKRYISVVEARQLSVTISRIFSREVTPQQIIKTARLINQIENQMIGRIAGDIEDYILNYYMVYFSAYLESDIKPAHAEIGVLFGGSLILMLFALHNSGSDHAVIAIDPLKGYYGENLDPVTNLPINRATLDANLSKFNFLSSKVTIISAMSESAEAIATTRNLRFGSLWIDGDHSYEGVKRDWENYSSLVVPGGYIHIDNYHDQMYHYPGIDRFVDGNLLPALKGWELVGHLNRSILFKKI